MAPAQTEARPALPRRRWNIAGIAIILQMRQRMEEMQYQIQDFVQYIQKEVLRRS
jgi:hypothetical protein